MRFFVFFLNLVCPFGDVNEGILSVAQSFFIKLQSWRKVAVQTVSECCSEGGSTPQNVEREREPAFIFNEKWFSIFLYFK